MKTRIRLRDVQPGTKITLGYDSGAYRILSVGARTYDGLQSKPFRATLVAYLPHSTFGDVWHCLLGWHDRGRFRLDPGWNAAEHPHEGSTLLLNAGMQLGYYVDENLIAELDCFYPDQKCVSCGISCPHEEPNVKTGYLCLPCRVYDELV